MSPAAKAGSFTAHCIKKRKMRNLTEIEQKEVDRLNAEKEKIELGIQAIINKPVVYGYIRVSSKGQAKDGNSLENQEKAVRAAGATDVRADVYTGATTDRPELDKLLHDIKEGDTLIVTKLDRISRSVLQGIGLVESLLKKGVIIHVLNLGYMDDSMEGQLVRTVMLGFAEFERNMILQRTREGKEIARLNPDYHEGRKMKYSTVRMDDAMEKLASGKSYSQVVEITGISKSTLIREKKRREALKDVKAESKD